MLSYKVIYNNLYNMICGLSFQSILFLALDVSWIKGKVNPHLYLCFSLDLSCGGGAVRPPPVISCVVIFNS